MQLKNLLIFRFLVRSFKRNGLYGKFEESGVIRREPVNTIIAKLSASLAPILGCVDALTSGTNSRIVRVRLPKASLVLQTLRINCMIQLPGKAKKSLSIGQLFLPCLPFEVHSFCAPYKCVGVNLHNSVCVPSVSTPGSVMPHLKVWMKSGLK